MKLALTEEPQRVPVAGLAEGGDFLFDSQAARAEARRAQSVWAVTPLRGRLAVIRRFRHLLAEQSAAVASAALGAGNRSLGEILSAEIIPLADACRFLERNAREILSPRRLGRRGRPFWLMGVGSRIIREPLGLVLVIAPCNYPLLLPGVQVVQALAAGNAVWLKPGTNGSHAANELVRLLHAAGLPSGLLRVLPEVPESAQAAIQAGVDKVLFTGSASIGIKVLTELAPHAVPSVMELSGCDAVIVRADADLDLTARALAFGLRLNSGQTCIAPRRGFVARSVSTELEGRLSQTLSGITPVVFAPALQHRLKPLLSRALSYGAHLLAGKIDGDGNIIGPLVVAGNKPGLTAMCEDVFAPLLALTTVSDDDEAVCLANDSSYALGAAIFSRDQTAAQSLAEQLNAGVVLINDLIAPSADARLPFGGRKLSGFGLTRGAEGLLEMTATKVIVHRSGKVRPHYAPPHPADAGLFRDYLGLVHGRGWRQRLQALRGLLLNLSRRKPS